MQLDLTTGHTSRSNSSSSGSSNSNNHNHPNNTTTFSDATGDDTAPTSVGVITTLPMTESVQHPPPPPPPVLPPNGHIYPDMLIRPSKHSVEKMIEPSSIYRHRTMNSNIANEPTAAKVRNENPDTTNTANSNMYSVPVVSMTNSHDSMDGYSLATGFYGGQRPINLRTSTTTGSAAAKPMTHGVPSVENSAACISATDQVVVTRSTVPLTHFVPTQPLPTSSSSMAATAGPHRGSSPRKTSPSWNNAQANKLTNMDDGADEEYSSDSESQFTYTQVGIVPLIKLSSMGPILNSMSMDSYDSSIDNNNTGAIGGKLYDAADDSSMLQLDDNVGMIADSPTFQRPGATTQHIYPSEEETPITTNATRQNARLTAYQHIIPTAPLYARNDCSDDPSPIRATILHLPKSSNAINRRQNDSSNNNQSFNSTLSSDIITMNKISDRHDDIDSQPSDEVMGDSMEQDLQGFADELDRIKRDIGLSSGGNKNAARNGRGSTLQQPQSVPTANRYLLQTRVPSDEFVDNEDDILPSTMIVTPDDAASKRHVHKNQKGRGRR